jgi:energy-converting hydrogenase Eha subunit C
MTPGLASVHISPTFIAVLFLLEVIWIIVFLPYLSIALVGSALRPLRVMILRAGHHNSIVARDRR